MKVNRINVLIPYSQNRHKPYLNNEILPLMKGFGGEFKTDSIKQERLGHTDAKTTLNTYAHIMPKTKSKVCKIFSNFEQYEQNMSIENNIQSVNP